MGLGFLSRKTLLEYINPVKNIKWYYHYASKPQPVLTKQWSRLTYKEKRDFEAMESVRGGARLWFFAWGVMMPCTIASCIYSYIGESEHFQHATEGHMPEYKSYDHMDNHVKDLPWGNGETSFFFCPKTMPMPNSKRHAQHMDGFIGFDKKGWPIWEAGYDKYGNPE